MYLNRRVFVMMIFLITFIGSCAYVLAHIYINVNVFKEVQSYGKSRFSISNLVSQAGLNYLHIWKKQFLPIVGLRFM